MSDERLAGEGLTVTMPRERCRSLSPDAAKRRRWSMPKAGPCGTLHFADLLRQEMSHEGAS